MHIWFLSTKRKMILHYKDFQGPRIFILTSWVILFRANSKKLSYVYLSLELHAVSTFVWNLTHQVLFLYFFLRHHLICETSLEDVHILAQN